MMRMMNRVDKDSVEAQLKEIVSLIETEQAAIDASFEKLLIAITNVLRLTNGQKSTLASLQGTPSELQGYLIDLASQIRKKASQTNERLLEKVNILVNELE
jgi:hypothetical protein